VTEYLLKTPVALIKAWWEAISQTLALTPPVLDQMAFAFRTWLTAMLALYIAFALQLESPYWAWLTVWIVAQPTPGMLLSKSLYLVIGTIGGAFFGITLIALFAQTPELFVLGLALLVAGCTVASNTLTNFRAYATVLTAYSAGIIASGAIDAPNQVFFIAMARAAAFLTGIACSIFVSSIFAPQRSAAAARDKLRTALQHAAKRAAYSWNASNEERLRIGRNLIQELIALDTVIEYAAAESANFRIQQNHARGLVAHLFSVLSARRALDAHVVRRGWLNHDALQIFHEVILDFLHEMPDRLDKDKIDELISGLDEVRRQVETLRPEIEMASSADVVSERLVIDQLEDFLIHLGGALEAWRVILLGRYAEEPPIGLNFHRDLRAAWINGLRAFLAICAAGAFWIGSAWNYGPTALIYVSVLLSLFSSQPHPERVGWKFFYAGLAAVFLALVCKFLVLPTGAGFEFLAVTLGFVLIPLAWLTFSPSTAAAAGAFSFVFVTLVKVLNPMVYDLSDTLNTWLAIQTGILIGTLSYILIFPPDPVAARRYVTYRIRRGLEMISLLDPVPPTNAHWETRMYDRVMRLNDPNNPSATATDEWLDAGLGALNLGTEILRLRRWLESENMTAEVRMAVTKVIDAFGRFLPEPQRVVEVVRGQIQALAQLDPGPGHPQRRSWARVLGALEEMAVYLVAHPRLTKIQPNGG
jgi:uncharacterized membrane protein YccC